MRLGTRWQAGSKPPEALPAALLPAIAEWEREHPEARSWTLTWLEGRPRCALDGVGTLTLGTAGEAIVEGERQVAAGGDHDADIDGADDDWLT